MVGRGGGGSMAINCKKYHEAYTTTGGKWISKVWVHNIYPCIIDVNTRALFVIRRLMLTTRGEKPLHY